MNWLKDLIENRLDDNARVLLFGLGDGAVERIKENITSAYKGVGGSEGFTDRDLEEKLKDMQRSMLPQMGSSFGAFSAQIKLSEDFKFSTVPGVQAAAKTMDGYGAILGEMFQTRAELLHGYGMTAKGIAQGAYGALMLSRPVIKALMALPKTIQMMRTALAAGKGVMTAARALRVATAPSALFNPVSLLLTAVNIVAVEGIGMLAYRSAEEFMASHAMRQAIRAHTSSLVNPDRVSSEFAGYRNTFMRHDYGSAYEVMEGMLTSRFMGASADMFGYDYNQAASITRRMALSGFMPESQQGAYATRAMQLDGMFGTGSMFEGTMADMSRITLGGDVDEATELFQQFFSSLVVDGRLHVAQLSLVGELSGFSENYVMGKMFNLEDGASNLARTHQFLNPIFGDRHSTAATQEMVRGVDAVLERGAYSGNMHVAEIMARTGITRGEAAYGITSSPDVLEKFLYGMFLHLGIGVEGFDENGDLGSDDMQRYMSYTQHGLGMDLSTARATYAAYRSFVGGARGESVNTEYAAAMMTSAGEGSDDVPILSIVQEWTRGSRVLSEITFEYADIMLEMHTAIANMGKAVMPSVMANITGRMGSATEVLNGSIFDPLSRVTGSGGGEITLDPGIVFAAPDEDRFTRLYNSLIQQESGGVHTTAEGALLESSAGARGISQVMRATGENPGYGVAPLKDQSVEEYLRFGEDYLSAMLREYNNDESKALAAYNWGPGNVNWAIATYGANWLEYAPQETKDYVRKVLGRLQSVGGSLGGFTPSSNYSFSGRGSQITTDYVNIDVELVVQDTSDFARHFEKSFMRA